MKILDGRELVGYIQERQAKQVRALRRTSIDYFHPGVRLQTLHEKEQVSSATQGTYTK